MPMSLYYVQVYGLDSVQDYGFKKQGVKIKKRFDSTLFHGDSDVGDFMMVLMCEKE